MKKKVIVTDFIFPNLKIEEETAKKAKADFFSYQCHNQDEIAQAVVNADVILVQFAKINKAVIDKLKPQTRIIRYGVGYDNIDVAYARKQGHEVAYIPDYCTDEVADHSVALLLMLLRKIDPLNRSVKNGEWAAVKVAKPIKPLSETCVGIIGFGRIGMKIASRLKPFHCQIMACDPAISKTFFKQQGILKLEFTELISKADAIVLTSLANKQTQGMINASTLKKMKENSVIINCSRGELIVEKDLIQSLKSGKIYAGLDVFSKEPLPATSKLKTCNNAILTPHAAWYSTQSITRLQQLAAQEMLLGIQEKPPRCPAPK